MTLWVWIAAMCLLATAFVTWPMYRHQQRLTAMMAAAILVVVGISVSLYVYQGSPDLKAGATDLPGIEEVINGLVARLENEPSDIRGWKMLGRSYMTMRNYSGAAMAYERVIELENSTDAQSLVELGEAILARDNGRIAGRTSALFESALAIDPNNPEALFYGGIGALNRGDQDLAVTRWEILLGLNPPAEIEEILRLRIAEWRGESPVVIEEPGAIVNAAISLSDLAASALPAEATVFIIARDPAQPSPPIAVVRRRLSELPDTVRLTDGDSMVPGRSLSGFPEFELIARVSLTGQPGEHPGDWFGVKIVKPAEADRISLSIDQEVP